MTIPCFKSLDPVATLLMARKWCWVHGDMVVSTQSRSPPAELPLKPAPPHLRYGKTPQWCYMGDLKARGKAFLGKIKQEKIFLEEEKFSVSCQSGGRSIVLLIEMVVHWILHLRPIYLL